MTQETPSTCDLLVHNAHVLSMDAERRVYPSGAVAVTGRDIVAVGPEREVRSRFKAARSIDAGGATVHPGFVDGHYHLDLHLTRGVVTDDPAVPAVGKREGQQGVTFYGRWLNAMDDEAEHASALVAAAEMACCGITCFMEAGNVFEPDAAAEAIERVGIRALLADTLLWDTDDIPFSRETERAPANLERCLETLGGQLRRNADVHALVRGHVAIYGSGSASDALEIAASRCARENGVVLNQHLAFLPGGDVNNSKRSHDRHPARHLADIGVLGPHCTLVHCNVLDEDAMAAIEETGAAIVWHPANYMFYGVSQSAPYRLPRLAARGVPMGLGTDVAKGWSFGQGAFVAYLLARNAGEYVAPARLLEMMTIDGARAVGLADRIGSLEPGKRADLVIRRHDTVLGEPMADRVLDLMLVSRNCGVHTVVCDGRVVVEDGRLANLDTDDLRQTARTTTQRLCEKADIASLSTWPEYT